MKYSWQDKHVLITGCAGLLGCWLAEELVKQGSQVTGVVRDWTPNSRIFRESIDREMNIVYGCVEDLSFIERVINEFEIDSIFHLAAQTIVGTSNRSPLSSFESNIKGTWTVLEACRHLGITKRIIVASSDKAYGSHSELPYRENYALKGHHPYDVSKTCADLISQAYHRTYGLPICISRCGNLFGGGDLNFNRLIPGTIRSLHLSESPIVRSDGLFVRDFLYVRDGVNALLQLAEQMDRPEIVGEAFNFSYETPIKAIEMVEHISVIMNRGDLKPIILNQATNEIREQYLSSEKARTRLGWCAEFDIETGLRETISWYRGFFQEKYKEGAFQKSD